MAGPFENNVFIFTPIPIYTIYLKNVFKFVVCRIVHTSVFKNRPIIKKSEFQEGYSIKLTL